MIQAIIYGLISGFALILGALIGIYFKLNSKTIASFMAFGSGVLICAVTFGLIDEAFTHGGFDAVIIGFLVGGLLFLLGDYFLHKIGARKHRRFPLIQSNRETKGRLITLGSLLDGIPESIALGIVLFGQQGIGLLMLVAIFLSNFPESISSIPGLKKEGFSKKKILAIWIIVGILTAVVTLLSFVFLHDIHPKVIGALEAFAAGAILMMLTDSMIPEAYRSGGFGVAIFTLFGFLTSFIVSRLKLP